MHEHVRISQGRVANSDKLFFCSLSRIRHLSDASDKFLYRNLAEVAVKKFEGRFDARRVTQHAVKVYTEDVQGTIYETDQARCVVQGDFR